jgi:NAD(P)-dependent dehydrogenase (short-subunit alcohol dehydrogenase family)
VIVENQKETLEEGKKIIQSYGTKVGTLEKDEKKWPLADLKFESWKLSSSTSKCRQRGRYQNAVATAVAEFSSIDYAANFTGILGSVIHTFETALGDYQKTMAANFTGIILSTNDGLNQNDGTGSPSIRKSPLKHSNPTCLYLVEKGASPGAQLWIANP